MPVTQKYYDRIAISGHRVYPDRSALLKGLNSIHAREYTFGGALGVDTDALEHIAKTQPRAVRTVVVPNRVADQPRLARHAIRKYSTRVIELRNTGPDRYMIRNRFMVDRSNRLSAFYDFRGRGGTYNTIEYARKTGKPFTTFPLKKYDTEQFRAMSREDFNKWTGTMKRFKVPLRAIKNLIIDILSEIYMIKVSEFLAGLGYPGAKTLEQFWRR